MSQRNAIIIATAVTAFLLVLGGALAGRMAQAAPEVAEPVAPEQAAPAEVAAPPITEVSPDVQVLLEREAQYQQLLEQANQRLQEAYDQQAAQPTQPAQPEYPVTSEQAVEIAMQSVPGAQLLSPPQLVNFEGSVAYEVPLDKGMVYVDANAGVILYNGALQIAGSSGGGGGSSTFVSSEDGSGGNSHESGNQGGGGQGGHEEEDDDD